MNLCGFVAGERISWAEAQREPHWTRRQRTSRSRSTVIDDEFVWWSLHVEQGLELLDLELSSEEGDMVTWSIAVWRADRIMAEIGVVRGVALRFHKLTTKL